jgi:hypothetical protein
MRRSDFLHGYPSSCAAMGCGASCIPCKSYEPRVSVVRANGVIVVMSPWTIADPENYVSEKTGAVGIVSYEIARGSTVVRLRQGGRLADVADRLGAAAAWQEGAPSRPSPADVVAALRHDFSLLLGPDTSWAQRHTNGIEPPTPTTAYF